MTIDALFYRRLINGWKQRLKAWRLVVDWTVALYFIVPLIGVVIYNYVALWLQTAAWVEYFPLVAIYFIYFLHACRGDLHYFLEEGDQLFLRQRSAWMIGLRKRGVAYSLLTSALVTDLLTLALLPMLLNVFGWSMLQVIVCALFSFLSKLYVMVVKQYIDRCYVRLRRMVYMVVTYILFAFVFLNTLFYLASHPIILGATCALLIYPLFRILQANISELAYYVSDIQRAQKALENSRSFIMSQAGIKKKGWFVPTSPLIFRKSTRLFKERTVVNIIAENTFKSFFRKWSLVRMYIQYTVVITVAIAAVTPLWLKGMVWILGILLLMYWLKSYWNEVMTSSYYKLLKFSFSTQLKAADKATWMLVAPAYSLVTLINLLIIMI